MLQAYYGRISGRFIFSKGIDLPDKFKLIGRYKNIIIAAIPYIHIKLLHSGNRAINKNINFQILLFEIPIPFPRFYYSSGCAIRFNHFGNHSFRKHQFDIYLITLLFPKGFNLTQGGRYFPPGKSY